jgi:hypothetical protein
MSIQLRSDPKQASIELNRRALQRLDLAAHLGGKPLHA